VWKTGKHSEFESSLADVSFCHSVRESRAPVPLSESSAHSLPGFCGGAVGLCLSGEFDHSSFIFDLSFILRLVCLAAFIIAIFFHLLSVLSDRADSFGVCDRTALFTSVPVGSPLHRGTARSA